MKTITFFNNKGGVGKTTTVYHVAWMLSEMGIKSIVIDLDPQSNLTSMFLSADRLEAVYEAEEPSTVLKAIEPVISGEPYEPVHIEEITEYLETAMGQPLGTKARQSEIRYTRRKHKACRIHCHAIFGKRESSRTVILTLGEPHTTGFRQVRVGRDTLHRMHGRKRFLLHRPIKALQKPGTHVDGSTQAHLSAETGRRGNRSAPLCGKEKL